MNIVESRVQTSKLIAVLSGLTTLFADTTLSRTGKDCLRLHDLRTASEHASNGIHLPGFLNQMTPSLFSGWQHGRLFSIEVREA